MILSPDPYSRPRPGLFLFVVTGVHAAAVGALLVELTPAFEPSVEMPAIAVEMASPAALPAPVVDAPTPQQIEAPEPTPQEPPDPRKSPFDPPPPLRVPAVRPEVVLPLRSEERPQPERTNPMPPAPVTTDAAAPDLKPADRTTAAVTGGASAGRATATDLWDARVRSRIELTKRYPAAARNERQEDSVTVLLTMDRNGRLLDARVRNSRGLPLLDAAALDAVRRASPFPRAPAELAGDPVRISVIVNFRQRGR